MRKITGRKLFQVGLLVLLTLLVSAPLLAQLPTGSIQGTVTDPSHAVVSGAKVTIRNAANGQELNLTTSSAGTYNSGPLLPGTYSVEATAAGFSTTTTTLTVSVGIVSTGNLALQVGSANEKVNIEATTVSVNTEQPTVQGVLTASQIENVPISGRNFLDLATFEPGVQIQDGGNFDPTKNGFSSVSFQGRFGRTARITLDGIDVSDETVGTTTQNIPAGGIQEFQISQSSLDVATDLTSSGAVNVVTKSGTNGYHGEGFWNFRDRNAGMAAFPGGQTGYFQRNQYGGQLGGYIIKDKLFFFGTAEHVRQPFAVPLTPESQFAGAIPNSYPATFKDTTTLGRLDWNIKSNMRMFYRFTYNFNSDISAYGATYQPFANRDNTPAHGIGWDYTSGNFTHSVRFGYLKFQNHIADAVLGSSVYDPAGSVPVAIHIGGGAMRFGPSRLAPQATFQSNKELKYDGTWIHGKHILRYGVAFNKILGGGYASFYLYPEIRTLDDADAQLTAASGPYPGGASNPLNYPVYRILAGNGQGFYTPIPQFGFPAGGQYDTRLGLYFGDSWKFTPRLTITLGLRYDRDTGRTDSQYPEMTCDQIDAAAFGGQVPCTGKQRILDQFGNIPNLGARVRQPNTNFGPQAGFAWDVTGSGKTVIRGGAGLFYENVIFNNILFDSPGRQPNGLFWGYDYGSASSLLGPGYAGARVGDVINATWAYAQNLQATTKASGAAVNYNFLGEALAEGANSNGGGFFYPGYRSPRSIQMNLGFQHEIHPGVVLSVDFIRNVGEHFLIGYDTNHLGDAKYLNKTAALNAIAATVGQCGVADLASVVALAASNTACPGGPNPNTAITWVPSIQDFAVNGLTSGNDGNFTSGYPASALGLTPDTGAAFPGINPLVGEMQMEFPIGRSTYTGVQAKLVARKDNLLGSFIPHSNWTISWAGSRFNTNAFGGDQDFLPFAWDQNEPTRYYGPGSLDRTFQLGIGGFFQIMAHGPTVALGMHFNSPLATSLYMENQGRPGEIFFTDLTGDGESGDPIQGYKLGTFGRGVNGGNINNVISTFNKQHAGTFSPAAQTLINNGLFSAAQLQTLGAVIDTVSPAPSNEFSNPWYKAFDAKLAWPVKVKERLTIEPSVGFYNLFNFANFGSLGGVLSPVSSSCTSACGSEGNANGTSSTTGKEVLRRGLGTGVNTAGAPRQIEWSLKLTF